MVRLSSLSLSAFIICSCLVGAAPGEAERKWAPLKVGLRSTEVTKLWGLPAEREEQEIKRLEIWSYAPGVTVTLHEGKVVRWKVPEAIDPASNTDAVGNAPTDGKGVEPSAADLNPDTRDLVREIAKEVPSGPDVALPDAPEPPPAVAPPPIANSMPQAGALQDQPPMIRGPQLYPPDEE